MKRAGSVRRHGAAGAQRQPGSRSTGRSALYAATVSLGAFLLFVVQPMAGKALLPVLGGSPAVWNACMLFFQLALLAGYALAHVAARGLRLRAQVLAYAATALACAFALPLAVRGEAPASSDPSLWVLGALTVSLAAPFVAVAATGPLVQRWYTSLPSTGTRDPYVLYAASNLGSFAGLLAYPVLIEPSLPLGAIPAAQGIAGHAGLTQALAWTIGYCALLALAVACGAPFLRAVRRDSPGEPARADASPEAPSWRTRALWIALAAVPSSLVLGTTLEITTDVAAVPMLWVAPLGLYLLTYVVAFAWPDRLPLGKVGAALALLATAIACLRWIPSRFDPLWVIALYLAALTAAGLLAHGTLARTRPHPTRLTEFYLLLAVGGALGGLFNALVAPRVFDSIAEYPIVLVLACLARPATRWDRARGAWRRVLLDAGPPLVLGVAVAATLLARQPEPGMSRSAPALLTWVVTAGALLALPRRVAFAGALAVLFIGVRFVGAPSHESLHRERTFFGVLHIVKAYGTPFRMIGSSDPTLHRIDSHDLFHGTTRHGREMLEPRLRAVPTTYYHRSGPIGRIFRALQPLARAREVGIVGLGVGTLAAYGRPGDRFTFFEIDPAVERIARDTSWFTFLERAASAVEVKIGDGRRLVAREPPGRFDLLVIDAFTSDAIPVHFLTREAFAVWSAALRDDGVLALHLSSTYFDLVPVVNAAAKVNNLSGVCWSEDEVPPPQLAEGKAPSIWVALVKRPAALPPIVATGPWRPLGPPAGVKDLWTDELARPLRALRRFAQ